MIAHTPGPWQVRDTDTRTAIKAGRRTVAYVQISVAEYDNACLIAAAPDLKTALQECIFAFGSFPDGARERHAIELARAAVAKAEGRS